jgi:hypothetical protein
MSPRPVMKMIGISASLGLKLRLQFNTRNACHPNVGKRDTRNASTGEDWMPLAESSDGRPGTGQNETGP